MQDKSLTNTIFRGTIVILAVSIIAKFASFISEAVMAAYLGTTVQSDAFYMVSGIQQVLYPMLSVGIWKVFLPLYKEKIAKKEEDQANNLANKVITIFTLISIIFAFVIFVFSDIVVAVIAPGFTGDTKSICSQLVRISAPLYIFILVSAIYASMLQAHNKFFGSKVREVISHIPSIVAAIFFYHRFGIEAMAISLVVASLLRFLIELPFVDWGYRYKPDLKLKDQNLAIMGKRLPAAFLSEGVVQINTLVDKTMASSLSTGAISSLNYGSKLMNVVSGLLSSAIATALFPQMVELIALNKREELNRLMTKILNIFAVLMIPASLACLLFSKPLVTAVFQRGAFTADSTSQTAAIFAGYCVGLFFIACNSILSNVFFGHGDTRTPLIASTVNLGANVVGNIVFIGLWGAPGLALSTSTSAIVAFTIRMILARKYITIDAKNFMSVIMRVVPASAVCCGIPTIICYLIHTNVYLELILAAVLGIAIYFIMLKLFKVKEMDFLISLFSEKIGKLKKKF